MKSARTPSTALAAVWLLGGLAGVAHGDTYPRQPVDVQHYDVDIVFDDSFAFEARLRVDLRLLADDVTWIHLDLEGPRVDDVTTGGRPLDHRHAEGRLAIAVEPTRPRGSMLQVEIRYRGRPDGTTLIARPNTHGRPALFANNWPEGARRWLPTVDHPSDKATVEFTVTASERFDVVAPGRLVETRPLSGGRRLTRWSEGIAIPTYCMVVGLAEFQVTRTGTADSVPLSVWVFPPDAAAAGEVFGRSALMLEYFSDRLGPFPYHKLAQVQSTIGYAGMENASAIFYGENELHGPGVDEFPVAHEIAHQWWGNSVTPADWDDLWLSEGFATYFDALFYEHVEGPEALRRRLAEGKRRVRAVQARGPKSVVDPAVTDPLDKLDALVYQKGAWVLHMLRHRIGDEAFFQGMREFYERHAGGNATTGDLREILEATTGESLERFFHQWLRRPGMPELRVVWSWDETAGEARVEVTQTQEGGPYEASLEIAFIAAGETHKRAMALRGTNDVAQFELNARPSRIEVDPDRWLLHTATVEEPRPPATAHLEESRP